jgi:aminoglycoside/choline kinase family phosphotransferase
MHDSLLDDFLAAQGYLRAQRHPLPGDAGHRRYTRLDGGPLPALLMDARGAAQVGVAGTQDLHRFVEIARHLAAHGVRSPRILGAEPDQGLLLVEDLGPQTMADALEAGEPAEALYLRAAETLAALHAAPPPAFLPLWEGEAMARTVHLTFSDWWWPAAMGAPPSAAQREALTEAIEAMLAPFAGTGCFVHRDYFPANLIPLADGRLGVIDFQDAGIGHAAYDLVSLVEDARRPVPDAIRAAAIARYLALRPELAPATFHAAMAAMAAQRHLRVAALWTRLARRDGKPGYLRFGPLCWGLLDRALQHPAAAPLARFLDRHIPADRRRNPPEDMPL